MKVTNAARFRQKRKILTCLDLPEDIALKRLLDLCPRERAKRRKDDL